MVNVNDLLRESMRVKPESKRGARQKSTTPGGMVRMNYNENCYGMSPKAREVLKKEMPENFMYQDFFAVEIRSKIAAFHHVSPDSVIIGTGSSGIIEMLGSVFLNYGDEVVYCDPTYEAFPDMISDNGGVRVPVPLTSDYRYDLDGMLAKVNERTKMVVIVNPNNPTGTCVRGDKVEAFIRKLPSHVVVVVDEAYFEYVTDPKHYSMIRLIQEDFDHPVVVLRTFSKIYGMAGLRIGYGVADPVVIDALMKASDAWNVSRAATAAAEAALSDQDYVEEVRSLNAENRTFLCERLRDLGCEVTEPAGNFIYFNPHCDSAMVKNALEYDDHIMIGAPDPAHNRVTIGTRTQNEAFLKGMEKILKAQMRKDQIA